MWRLSASGQSGALIIQPFHEKESHDISDPMVQDAGSWQWIVNTKHSLATHLSASVAQRSPLIGKPECELLLTTSRVLEP